MLRRTCKVAFSLALLLIAVPPFAIAQTALVNINTATLEELDTLPGVGPVIAQRIIDGRPYATIEEISKVNGIGDPGSKSYEDIKNLITVGGVSVTEDEEDTGVEPGSTQPSPSSPSTSSSPSSLSTHYSSSPLSNKKSEVNIHLGAGRNRLGSVGSPLEFKVETDMGYTRNSIFKWNFGDGSEGAGDVVVHVYEYPGDYVVVLNASVGNSGQATARTDVKIVESEINILTANSERIEIKNNSRYEVSLFGRVLVAGVDTFLFPQDTIMKAGQSISFSSKITGLRPSSVHDTILLVVGEKRMQSDIAAEIEEQKEERIAYLTNQIATLQQKMVGISQSNSNLAVSPPSEEPVIEDPFEESVELEIEEDEIAKSQTAAASDGWLAVLKRFFLRTQ